MGIQRRSLPSFSMRVIIPLLEYNGNPDLATSFIAWITTSSMQIHDRIRSGFHQALGIYFFSLYRLYDDNKLFLRSHKCALYILHLSGSMRLLRVPYGSGYTDPAPTCRTCTSHALIMPGPHWIANHSARVTCTLLDDQSMIVRECGPMRVCHVNVYSCPSSHLNPI